ncbi:MAG: CopG family transcriptional regulator [SAR202 cluster bacterium]|nr:CopG family transcriptional regulator [SAR202 cluster bacterium]
MKNVQVRFSDEVYKGLDRIAQEEGISLSEVLRRAIQLYGILRAYQKEGKELALVDKSGQLHARLVIPGITAEAPGETRESLKAS